MFERQMGISIQWDTPNEFIISLDIATLNSLKVETSFITLVYYYTSPNVLFIDKYTQQLYD